jgi:hypothetical protein
MEQCAIELAGRYKIPYLLRMVMQVDGNLCYAVCDKKVIRSFKQRFPANRDKRFGNMIGERFKPCAEPGSKNESDHEAFSG